MSAWPPAVRGPVTSVAEAIARMEAIAAALPAADGLACFNHLEVTRQVAVGIGTGFYADPGFMTPAGSQPGRQHGASQPDAAGGAVMPALAAVTPTAPGARLWK